MGAHGGHVWWASDVWRRLQAKPLFEEALAARRETLGDRHPDTLISINNLGLLLKAQGRLDEARSPPMCWTARARCEGAEIGYGVMRCDVA